jgi:glycosyltransferase involved in cell wall biosynthesis
VQPALSEPTSNILRRVADRAGLRRVHVVAWRDLEDPDAGGSETHAARLASHWAAAGIEVTMRTSAARGLPPETLRDGYRVVRRGGRYAVFPRAALAGALRLDGRFDGLVEVWNGMPFFSPLWSRRPGVVFCHHVHAELWPMVLPTPLARLGQLVERRIAPPLYRRRLVLTSSPSAREDLVTMLGLRPDRVAVVPIGVDPCFSPGGTRAPTPLVLAVGRLVPSKRFEVLVQAFAELRARHPALEAVIVGEGCERPRLEAQVRALGAEGWCRLAGRVAREDLVELYRRAWVVASASVREGWGMTVTEAAACGTPAVVSAVTGHRDSVVDGETGLLASNRDELVAGLDRVLSDPALRERLGRAALARARGLRWEATALAVLEALAAEAKRASANKKHPVADPALPAAHPG